MLGLVSDVGGREVVVETPKTVVDVARVALAEIGVLFAHFFRKFLVQY